MSTEQDIQEQAETQECTDLTTNLSQVKRSRIQEPPHTRRKTKTAKTLEKDFLDSSELARDVTKGALEELMSEQTTVLGELRAQLQALQVRPPGGMIPTITEGIPIAEQMVHASTMNTLVLLAGVVLEEVEGDMGGWGLNLAALLRETLYQLEDGVTAELCTRQGRALQVLIEQKGNLE